MLSLIKEQWDRMTGEVRKSTRKMVYVPVYYQFPNEPWILSKALNISNNGACVLLHSPVKVGEVFGLEMPYKNLGGSEVLSIKAEVRWVKESIDNANQFECGIAFKEKQVKYRREKSIVFSLADINCAFLEHHTRDCVGKTANTLEELKEAYSILYNEYSSRNLCSKNEARLYYNFYNLTPGARTFVLKRGKDILGTMSVILDSPCGLPMEATYSEEMKKFRAQGMRLGEIGCLALNSRFFSTSKYSLKSIEKQSHLFKLFKTMFDYARFVTDCTDLVMGCHPRHTALYRYLLLEEVGEVRGHNEVHGAPAVLMKLNLERFIRTNTLLNEGPGVYFLQNNNSMDSLKEHFPWTSQTVHKFLHHFRPLWGQLSEKQKEYLAQVYPTN